MKTMMLRSEKAQPLAPLTEMQMVEHTHLCAAPLYCIEYSCKYASYSAVGALQSTLRTSVHPKPKQKHHGYHVYQYTARYQCSVVHTSYTTNRHRRAAMQRKDTKEQTGHGGAK